MAGLARPVTAAPGEALYQQGGPLAPLIVVHRGLVKLTRVTPDGRERVLQVMEPGDFVGEASLLSGGRPDHSAIAVTEVTLCTFRHEDFGGLLVGHPQIGFEMLGALSKRLADVQDKLEQTGQEVGSRVADYLLGLPAERGGIRAAAAEEDVASCSAPPGIVQPHAGQAGGAGRDRAGRRAAVVITDVDALSALTRPE